MSSNLLRYGALIVLSSFSVHCVGFKHTHFFLQAAFFDSPLPPVSTIHDSIPDIGLSMSRQGSPDSGIGK